MTTEITIRTAFSTFEIIVTPELDEAAIRAIVGGADAFAAIDEAAIANCARSAAQNQGWIISTVEVLTDEREIAAHLTDLARQSIQDRINADVEDLMAQLEEARAQQPPTRIVSDIILNEMPSHLETLEEIFAALSPEKLVIFEREGQVWASSKGYLPSMNPEGENVSFILVEGVIIGRYRKSVRFGQDISFEAPLGETIPVRAGRVAMDKRLALAKTKMIETALAKAKANIAE